MSVILRPDPDQILGLHAVGTYVHVRPTGALLVIENPSTSGRDMWIKRISIEDVQAANADRNIYALYYTKEPSSGAFLAESRNLLNSYGGSPAVCRQPVNSQAGTNTAITVTREGYPIRSLVGGQPATAVGLPMPVVLDLIGGQGSDTLLRLRPGYGLVVWNDGGTANQAWGSTFAEWIESRLRANE